MADAHAQMCSADAGCQDGGEPLDSGMMTPMDGAVPEDDGDPMTGDGGELDASTDAGMSDGGDAGGVGSVAACSCETALDNGGRIHVCTGSFDRATCRSFSCELGTPRAGRCTESGVRLCCEMKARRLYTNLYDDCDHPNCEAGFRAQCSQFGGDVIEGACEAPELPDDTETDVGLSCAVSTPGATPAPWLAWLALCGACLERVRRRRRDR
jgi:hypothetical protein